MFATGPPPGYVQLRSADEVDEKFLSEFSWGPGCGYYFFSRAMFVFLLASVVVGVISYLIGQWADTVDANTMSSSEAVTLMVSGFGLIAIVFWLLIYAGKVARRRRWQMLNWSDFDAFRKSEQMWKTLGMIGWGATILGIVKEFVAPE